jgi:quercetin dioxygenase-like cupin family protein
MRYFYDKFEEYTYPYIADISGTQSEARKNIVLLDIPPAREFRMAIGKFQPGTGNTPHTHEWEHAMYIMKGKCKAVVETEEAILVEGMVGFAPRNAVHYIHNVGETELVVLGISGPPRTEAGYAQLKKK